MFWKRKRKKPDKLRFQHYVPLMLSTNILAILEKKAKGKSYSELHKVLTQMLACETFIMACMIGTRRSDVITGILRENDENYEQFMKETRDGLTKIIEIMEQKGEINLNVLPLLIIEPEMDILPKDDPAKGLTIEATNRLGIIFIYGYTFGHDHPQLFLEMLKKQCQERNKNGPNTSFIWGMLSIYSPLIEEGDRSFLLNINGLAEIRLAYENGTLPQKLVSIYKNIASELVRQYELTVGPLK